MSRVTAVLLNWKRPNNLKRVIQSIRNQTEDIDIWLWNNNHKYKTRYNVEKQFNSSINLMCWPRWILASTVKTDYIFTIDDDLQLIDINVIGKCVRYMDLLLLHRQNIKCPIIGYTGVKLNDDINYWRSKHIYCPDPKTDIIVDIVKGRFMFLKQSILNNISMQYTREDDIKISSYSDFKIIPSIPHSCIKKAQKQA